MKKIAIAGIAVFAMFLLTGCPSTPVLDEAPEIYKVELTEGTVKLYWHASLDAESEDFKEYVVYAFDDSTLYDLAGDNDTLADYEETFTTDTSATLTLAFDKIWYCQVRNRNLDDNVGDYNLTKPYVACSPRKGGTAVKVYGQTVNANSQCGFIFKTGATVDTMNLRTADWFLDVYRVAGVGYVGQITNSYARYKPNGLKTGIKELTTSATSIDEQILIDDSGWSPGDSLGIRATKAKFYGFKCVDTTFAKILVDSVFIDSVNVQNSFVRFDWAWQNIPDFRYLGPEQ